MTLLVLNQNFMATRNFEKKIRETCVYYVSRNLRSAYDCIKRFGGIHIRNSMLSGYCLGLGDTKERTFVLDLP